MPRWSQGQDDSIIRLTPLQVFHIIDGVCKKIECFRLGEGFCIMIRLVIFDFDGVLCPLNYQLLFEVYQYIVQEMHLRPDWGKTFEEFKAWFSPQYVHNLERMGAPQPEKIREAERLFREFLSDQGYNLFPELHQILPRLSRIFTLAIVTNGPELRAKLQLKELSGLFGAVIGRESLAGKVKPDPYGVLLCLERFHVSADEAVIIGDDPGDILAGKKAGLAYTIGVSWGLGLKEDLQKAGADRIVESIAELSDLPRMLGSPTNS